MVDEADKVAIMSPRTRFLMSETHCRTPGSLAVPHSRPFSIRSIARQNNETSRRNLRSDIEQQNRQAEPVGTA